MASFEDVTVTKKFTKRTITLTREDVTQIIYHSFNPTRETTLHDFTFLVDTANNLVTGVQITLLIEEDGQIG